MSVIERDVVLQSVDENGRQTMDFPITRLGNVEDSADVKQIPVKGDYLPIVDSEDGGQMKKMPYSAILEPMEAAQTAAEDAASAAAAAAQTAQAAKETAEAAATMEQVNGAIQAAILDSWEGSY